MAVNFKGGFEDRKGKLFDCEPVDCKPVDCAAVECIPVDCKPVDCAAVECIPVDCNPVDCKPVDCAPVECTPVIETVIEYLHPISSDEIRYLLMILKKSTFTGEEMENLVVVTMKLQEEYKKVLDKEEKNK